MTAGTIQGTTHPRTPAPEGRKYQVVSEKEPKQATKSEPSSFTQEDERDNGLHFFLSDKTDADKDHWYIGLRLLGGATKPSSRCSFLRQAYNHNLMTEWSTSHISMPPWLRDEELDTRVFEIKACTAKDIMKVSIDHLSGIIEDLATKSATSLAKVEGKFTTEELLVSRAALAEHGALVSDPLKQALSKKREYLRRYQPSLTDLITMRNRDRDFPKKANTPPAKNRRAPSAALGRAPDSQNDNADHKDDRNKTWADQDDSVDRREGHKPRLTLPEEAATFTTMMTTTRKTRDVDQNANTASVTVLHPTEVAESPKTGRMMTNMRGNARIFLIQGRVEAPPASPGRTREGTPQSVERNPEENNRPDALAAVKHCRQRSN